MITHTKGPLRVAQTFIENTPTQYGVYAKRVAGGPFNGEMVALCEKEENANLFAVAPEMFETLKALMQTGFILNAPPCTCKAGHRLPSDCAICRARQVIAEIEGYSP
jgi:hypothetical protein